MKKIATILMVSFVMLMLVICTLPTAEAIKDPFPIYGKVTDENGAAVSGATVTIKNLGNGDELETTTNSYGEYTVELLNMDSEYEDGHGIKITATKGTKTGSNTITVLEGGPGSEANVQIAEAAAIAGLSATLLWALLIIIIVIMIILFLITRRKKD